MNNRDQFKKVTTGKGFQNDLIATTNDRLELTVIELQNLQDSFKRDLKLTRESVTQLETTIKSANDKNDRLQKWFLVLGVIGTLLTATQLVQVWDILVRGIGK